MQKLDPFSSRPEGPGIPPGATWEWTDRNHFRSGRKESVNEKRDRQQRWNLGRRPEVPTRSGDQHVQRRPRPQHWFSGFFRKSRKIGDAEKKNMAGAEISNSLKPEEGGRRRIETKASATPQFIVKPAGVITNLSFLDSF